MFNVSVYYICIHGIIHIGIICKHGIKNAPNKSAFCVEI